MKKLFVILNYPKYKVFGLCVTKDKKIKDDPKQ